MHTEFKKKQRALAEGGAVRDTPVSHQEEKWVLVIIWGTGSRWLAVRSRRETLRI